jgi:hypothetical protein
MNTPYTVNPDFDWGAAYSKATGGGGQQQQPQAGPSAEDLYWEQQKAWAEQDRIRQQDATADAVRTMFEGFGLGSLYPTILDYARKGYNADSILVHLRQTPEYKARFPAMEALSKKGRSISEADYVGYEKQTAAIEQRYGLPNGMLMGHVTDLLTEEVSVAELNDRVTIAVADSIMAPQDLKDQIRDYYGIDPETAMAAYYLDPDVALPLLEKQSQAARIGVWSQRQGLNGVGVSTAEELQALGVSEAAAAEGFGTVKRQEGLGAGRGDTASQDTRIQANLAGNASAQETTERAAMARVNRFAGGGSFAESKQGVGGLGGAGR